ncbi:hypothetical protein MGYG_01030 [Nannizzia gypsea CBS 118893]|uniref:Uncharacterized protein n=1 Tax=Arthroderma gypseum (strain ATCC MYA-4604 / CBS 118893) TaxID=535722 RepID=E5R3T4_ARTGP|nr:hypothetical protein MGYG_01030 [Nannizzia gypsea CBS 118893]EFQ97994.1 hypothetical protein MGYG_01030 [Nannizzia gypsea CBS 118893]
MLHLVASIVKSLQEYSYAPPTPRFHRSQAGERTREWFMWSVLKGKRMEYGGGIKKKKQIPDRSVLDVTNTKMTKHEKKIQHLDRSKWSTLIAKQTDHRLVQGKKHIEQRSPTPVWRLQHLNQAGPEGSLRGEAVDQ